MNQDIKNQAGMKINKDIKLNLPLTGFTHAYEASRCRSMHQNPSGHGLVSHFVYEIQNLK
jgi:hypothetical protein